MSLPPLTTNTTDPSGLRTLAERVLWARTRLKLSQPALAKRAGVSQGTIGNIEAGIREKPRQLVAIAQALDVSPVWLDSGRGAWGVGGQQQAGAQGGPPLPSFNFDSLTPDEQRFVANLRDVQADEDQWHELMELVAQKAARMRAIRERMMAQAKLPSPKPVVHSADARKQDIARAALEITDNLKQRSLFTDDSVPLRLHHPGHGR